MHHLLRDHEKRKFKSYAKNLNNTKFSNVKDSSKPSRKEKSTSNENRTKNTKEAVALIIQISNFDSK